MMKFSLPNLNASKTLSRVSAMKTLFRLGALSLALAAGIAGSIAFRPAAPSYEYRQFSTVESIVAGGLGRSRVITTDAKGNAVEKDLMNFYSLVGINFGNIANNDQIIVTKINEYVAEGWELDAVTTGSSTSQNNGSTSQGIFITRYLFRRAK